MEKRIKEECKICGGTGKIQVSSHIKKSGEVIPIRVFPCPRCGRKKNKS